MMSRRTFRDRILNEDIRKWLGFSNIAEKMKEINVVLVSIKTRYSKSIRKIGSLTSLNIKRG